MIPSAYVAHGCTITKNRNIHGSGKYAKIFASNIEECARKCSQNQDCGIFLFFQYSQSGECQMRSGGRIINSYSAWSAGLCPSGALQVITYI